MPSRMATTPDDQIRPIATRTSGRCDGSNMYTAVSRVPRPEALGRTVAISTSGITASAVAGMIPCPQIHRAAAT